VWKGLYLSLDARTHLLLVNHLAAEGVQRVGEDPEDQQAVPQLEGHVSSISHQVHGGGCPDLVLAAENHQTEEAEPCGQRAEIVDAVDVLLEEDVVDFELFGRNCLEEAVVAELV
jgi:hypothetical protein